MTYQITILSNGQSRTETAEGVKELHTSLALYRSQGWKIKDVSRAKSVVA